MSVECEHHEKGCCKLGLFGGKPSDGVCNIVCQLGVHKEAGAIPLNIGQKDLPGLRKQAKNYAGFLIRKVQAKLRGEETTVTQEIFDTRLKQCRKDQCGQRHIEIADDGDGGKYEIEKCAKCGCRFDKKLWEAVEKCPLGYWDVVRDKHKD